MNTDVWGPLLWNTLYDICFFNDTIQSTIQEQQISFTVSLAFILPCKYCRQSYTKYLQMVKPREYFVNRQALQWVWGIHHLVNKKLGKPTKFPFDTLSKRMNTWTHAGNANQLFDFLFIVGLNYDPNKPLKVKYMQYFHDLLPYALAMYPHIYDLFKKGKLKPQDLNSREAYLQWLYRKKKFYNGRVGVTTTPPLDSLVRRYMNAKAGNQLNVCGPGHL